MHLPRNASAKHFWKKPSFSHYRWAVLPVPQLTPLTAQCSVITRGGSLWPIIATHDRQCRKKARNGAVSTALLGKSDEDYAGWRELHGRRKHPPPALEEKVQTERSGEDAHLDFMCLKIKIRVGCCTTAPSWCSLGTGWTGKANSKCLPCLDFAVCS